MTGLLKGPTALTFAPAGPMICPEPTQLMIGAIAGDIIGSVYEYRQIKTKEFPLFHRRCHFTDDSVLIRQNNSVK